MMRNIFRLPAAALVLLAWTLAALAQPGDPYAGILRFKWGQTNAAARAIEAEIRAASPRQMSGIEAKLARLIVDPATSHDAKAWICRNLRLMGTEQSVAALAALLSDKDLAADALFALRSIASPKVDAALREALPRSDGLVKAGIVQCLGARGDRLAVSLLAPLASDRDQQVMEAALYALGQIGGPDALQALQTAAVSEELRTYRHHALLVCAESLIAAGKPADAAAVYQTVFTQAGETIRKIGALRGLLLADQAKAAPLLASALSATNRELSAAAAKFAGELAEPKVLANILTQWPTFAADTQVILLGNVTNPAALPAIRAAARSEEPGVRLAALAALGRLGDAASVSLLLEAAATGKGQVQTTARKGLERLSDRQADAALLAAIGSGAPPLKAEAIRALEARQAAGAVPTLLKTATDGDAAVRRESFKALGMLAGEKDLPALVRLLTSVKEKGDREPAENMIAAAGQHAADKDAVATLLLAGMSNPAEEVRASLLRALAQVPSPKGLTALQAATSDPGEMVRDAAIRGLADWPTAAPMPDLLRLAQATDSAVHRALCLRGFVRLAGLPGNRPVVETVKLLAGLLADNKLLPPGGAAEEKKLVLSALAELNHETALDTAASCLTEPAVEVEAASAVVRIAQKVRKTNPAAAAAALQKILDTCRSPAARQLAEGAGMMLNNLINIAAQGVATSPDGLEKDGNAGGDQAAIDGDPNTYWDEQDGGKLYRLTVTFPKPEKIAALSLMGWAHHNFAPKDFEVLADTQPVKQVRNAQYNDNFLAVPIPETTARTIELKITGYYGGSPAIRELGLYAPKEKR